MAGRKSKRAARRPATRRTAKRPARVAWWVEPSAESAEDPQPPRKPRPTTWDGDVHSLFEAPFYCCPEARYIFDQNNIAAMQDDGEFIARGWGGISYLDRADEAMDAWEALLAKLAKDCANVEELTAALNAEWTVDTNPGPLTAEQTAEGQRLRKETKSDG